MKKGARCAFTLFQVPWGARGVKSRAWSGVRQRGANKMLTLPLSDLRHLLRASQRDQPKHPR